MGKIRLGLDIGTNSIGWAVVELDEFGKPGKVKGLGSRIIPMDGDAMQKFESGATVSKNADRRQARMSRRLKQRYVLRRTRLITALKILGWIPESFPTDFKDNAQSQSKHNINDYLPFSNETRQEAIKHLGGINSKGIITIPDDWIVYYLRHKAMHEKITLSELARIIYMMNQRRGFKSSRKDIPVVSDDEKETKYPIYEKWVETLKIINISEIEEERGIKLLEIQTNSIKGTIKRRQVPEWIDKDIDLEVTKKTMKSGEVNYSFSIPNPTEWTKQKEALQKSIQEAINAGECKGVGDYFFQQLKENKDYRIRQRIVDRQMYLDEFRKIWETQMKYHPEMNEKNKLGDIAKILYKHNIIRQNEIMSNDLFYLFAHDIIYYQRPLKSQKGSIGFCNYEKRKCKDGIIYNVRVAPKSSPEFQEFRIWQTIHNIRIIQNEGIVDGKLKTDIDVSDLYLNDDGKAKLFELFDSKKEVSTKAILKLFNLNTAQYRLNYPDDKDFIGNETKEVFRKVFRKHKWEEGELLLTDKDKFYRIWHIIYSLNESKDIVSALKNQKNQLNIPDTIVYHLSKLPPFPQQYAAYSSKAIRKLLLLMRTGKFFDLSEIPTYIIERINKFIDGEFDQTISNDVREKVRKLNLHKLTDFQGLPLWVASYVTYNRHSEREFSDNYTSPEDIDPIKIIPNNSLRNPVVEQVTRETLSLVKDVWSIYGQPDTIHIELARDMKRTKTERENIAKDQFKNEADRKRIRAILAELKGANPDSPNDITRLRLWEETGNENATLTAIKFSKEPTSSEIEKYRLWGEQNHISPYTGKVIPLSKLFTNEYQIEHIIPRARFFDDSFSNKTICEAAVNSYKDNLTARELIEKSGGKTVNHNGMIFKLFSPEEYIIHCKKTFKKRKLQNLLREDIPEDFVSRQINDTRYITKKISEALYPVTRKSDEDSDTGIIYTIGSITDKLKDSWGLNSVWKEILKPRFERLEELSGISLVEITDRNDVKFKQDYKRVDHRHHALDALIIACTMRAHINYLNALNSSDIKDNYKYLVKSRYSDFVLPWEGFTLDVKKALNTIIVSHKNRNRVVTKGVNKYLKWKEQPDGTWKKELTPQVKGQLTSIRRSMFQEPLGKVYIREYNRMATINQALEIQYAAMQLKDRSLATQIANKYIRNKVIDIIKNSQFDLVVAGKFIKKNPLLDNRGQIISKVQIVEFNEYAAKRVAVADHMDKKWILKNIPDAEYSWLAKILLQHLENNDNDPKKAFTGEGIESLEELARKKISKVTRIEGGEKIELKGKLFETDKGSNVFFVIRRNLNEPGNDEMFTIPLLEAIERLANKYPNYEEKEGFMSFSLSPNDLVYVPEEGENISLIDWNSDRKRIQNRIYRMISCTGKICYFLPHYVARVIGDKELLKDTIEFESLKKSEKTIDGKYFIKKVCVKIKVDRLGNVIEAAGKKVSNNTDR